MATILTDTGEFTVATTRGLTLPARDVERITGWTLKPEGMCRDDVCVPLPATIAGDGKVDLAAFWHHLGNPLLSSTAQDVWVLGAGAQERNASLIGLRAPDITLPDLDGVPHSLSALHGRKIMLTTWASW